MAWKLRKMISPRRNSSLSKKNSPPIIQASLLRGFTLLEIVVVLAISALVIGGAIGVMVFSSSERVLKDTSSKIELLAKKARTASILHQIPYAIEIHPHELRLIPYRETLEKERFTALGNQIGGREVVEMNESSKTIHESFRVDSEISFKMRRWNEAKFLTTTPEFIPIWRFDPNGLCEPITLRIDYKNSYAQDTYHPLTATISDAELEAN